MAQAKATTPAETAELKTALGQAELGIGNPDLAKAAFAEAHAADAGYAPAYLGDAVLAARDGDFAAALAATTRRCQRAGSRRSAAAQGRHPARAGSPRRGDRRLPRKVLAKNTGSSPRTGRSSAARAREQDAEADKALEALKAVAPKHPKTFYSRRW